MTESQRRQIKGALQKCADENRDKGTPTCYVIVSSVCEAAIERINELEDAMSKARDILSDPARLGDASKFEAIAILDEVKEY